jgi:hypothetical protein
VGEQTPLPSLFPLRKAMAVREYASKEEQASCFRSLRSKPGNHVSGAALLVLTVDSPGEFLSLLAAP